MSNVLLAGPSIAEHEESASLGGVPLSTCDTQQPNSKRNSWGQPCKCGGSFSIGCGVASGPRSVEYLVPSPRSAAIPLTTSPLKVWRQWRIPMLLVFTLPAVLTLGAVFGLTWGFVGSTANTSVGDAVALLNKASAVNFKLSGDSFLFNKAMQESSLLPDANDVEIWYVISELRTVLLNDDTLTSLTISQRLGNTIQLSKVLSNGTDGTLLLGMSPVNGTNMTFWRLSTPLLNDTLEGAVVATLPFIASSEPWYQAALEQPETGFALTGPRFHPFLNAKEFVLSCPPDAHDPIGPPIVLGIGFTVQALFRSMLEAYGMLRTTGVMLLMDETHGILMSSSSKIPTSGELLRVSLATTTVDVQTDTFQSFGESFVLVAAIDGSQNGRTVISGQGLFAVIIIPRSDYFASIDRNSRVTVYLCSALIIAFVVLMGMLSYFLLVRPIRGLVSRLRDLRDALDSGVAPHRHVDQSSWISEIFLLFEATSETIRAAGASAASRAHEVAEARRRAKDTFFAMISHEMRTPLNGILGMTKVLLSTELTEGQQECAEAAYASGDSLLTLVNDLLEFSKLENESLVLEAIPFDIRQCVAKAAQIVQLKAEEKQIELICHVSASVDSQSTGDPTRLSQVLLNLLSNAVKFTPRGGTVVLRCSPGDGPWLHFEVRDTGIGMDASTMERLFRPFIQGDSTVTRKYGGTGLGLYISKKIVDAMGGILQASSEGLDKGSTFDFSLPHRLPAPGLPAAIIRHFGEEPQSSSQLPVVLIVDRNFQRREALQALLCHMGFVTEVLDCAQDLHAADEQGRVEVVLTHLEDHSAPLLELVEAFTQRSGLGSPRKLIFVTRMKNTLNSNPTGGYACVSSPVSGVKLLRGFAQLFKSEKLFSMHLNAEAPERAVEQLVAEIPPQTNFLVVDDIAINTRVLTLTLSRHGLSNVRTASSGAEAVEAARSAQPPFDVIFMDVNMPQMCGMEATRKIREGVCPGRAGPVVIGITGDVRAATAEACLASGMSAVLVKPLNAEKMLFEVARGLKARMSCGVRTCQAAERSICLAGSSVETRKS
eukprot:RCo022407